MSTYDDSSLFLYPSGYKASVLFAQKPMDANGQLAFARSNDTATRVASNGLIEKVRTNLVLQSQTFDNASWTKDASSITANTIAAPDGTLTAETLTADGTSAPHGIRQTGTATLTNGIVYSTSIYAKKGTNDFIQIVGSTAPYVTFNVFANFDLNNGVVGTIGSSVTATIQDVGNGWYRCTMIAAAAATSSTNSFIVQIVSSASAARGESNSLATSVFLWGAQLETSDFGPTPYIPTVAAAVSVGPLANIPRIDYLGGGCGKLLLEPQRTNSFQFSESFDNAYWTKQTCVVTANTTQTLDPSGYNGADFVVTDNGAASGVIQRIETITASQPVTLSVFLKYQGVPIASINCRDNATSANNAGVSFNIQTGVISTAATAAGTCSNASATITNYGNGWYRCTLTFTNSATTSFRLRWYNDGVGNGVNGTFGWGFQLEQNASYATSYVNTLAASVTRGADACSKTGISSLIGQTEGTLFAEFQINANNTDLLNRIFSVSDGTLTSRVLIIANTDETFRFVVSVASTTVVNITTSVSVLGGRHKVAFAYKANDFIAYVDGVQVGSNTAVSSVPASLTTAYVGTIEGGASAQVLEGTVSQAILFKTRLPNSELAALTAL